MTIPESVTTIGIRAFYGCSSLTEITIPGSVKNMETWDNCWAFSNCGNLRTITLNEGCVLGWGTRNFSTFLCNITSYRGFYFIEGVKKVLILTKEGKKK